MNEPNIDAELGLDAYGASAPGDWIRGVLDRLRCSPRWVASKIVVGVEDHSEHERVSLVRERNLDSSLQRLLSASDECSCFLAIDDSTPPWSLPLMFTREAGKTTLTASVYGADLQPIGAAWARIRLLLDLTFDLLLDETTEWLRFGVEGADITSPDSTLFLVLSETVWRGVAQETRAALTLAVEERSGFCVIWGSPPPGTTAPADFRSHFSALCSAIVPSC